MMNPSDYSLVNTLIAFVVVTLIGVGGPLFVLWRDNRRNHESN
jgi:hypothetical protein